MDRQATARERRRKQVQEHLEEEREREANLRDQLEERIAEADGPALDEQLFVSMSEEEAKLVRDGLAGIDDDMPPGEETFWAVDETWAEEDAPEGDGAELEEEIERLQRELEVSQARQRAYERYLELLGSG